MTALRVALTCHPETPSAGVEAIAVTVERHGDVLALRYELRGATNSLRIPSAASPVHPDRLWAHTCFEIFLARPGDAAYEEWNLSPSGQLAHYAFASYRVRAPDPAAARLTPHCEHDAAALRLAVRIPIADDGARIVGLTTVVEGGRGELSYWALRHGPGRPDFHRRATFALLVDRQSATLLPERDSP